MIILMIEKTGNVSFEFHPLFSSLTILNHTFDSFETQTESGNFQKDPIPL